MSLGKSVASIGGYTLISRIVGFVREILVAQILGAGPVSDAFFVAFKLPNFMRRIFAEGAFSASFVPLFSGALVAEGNAEAKRFAEDAQAVLSATLFALTSLMIVFMPYVLHAIAPGFGSNAEQFNLAVELARITFPYLLFISLVGLYGGVLNSLDRFTAYASAPILMNLCMIFGITVLADYSETPAHGLAYGVFLAGMAQLLWLIYYAHKAGFFLRLRVPRLTPGVKKLLKNMLPVMLGASVAQINLVVDMIIATHIENAVSYLNYADRINELPLGVIGVALGT
ncbi:MAG: murein biosynthesis integral membrane protein MurJ, partial [Alphaproteobacteria bacterium]|nr:murein biosynthesis integral membrane protein MurJ [Alphaproteobacteria bacterium]